jgi:hypothetical protein
MPTNRGRGRGRKAPTVQISQALDEGEEFNFEGLSVTSEPDHGLKISLYIAQAANDTTTHRRNSDSNQCNCKLSRCHFCHPYSCDDSYNQSRTRY